MAIDNPTDVRPGLRERKKQKTRDTIIKVARKLFAEQGYEQTTIAEIAEIAEVSPRTIFAYFSSKEDILFYDLIEIQERLAQALRERHEGTTALDALHEFIVGLLTPDSAQALRKRIVASDETLQRNERARYGPLEQLMAEAIAEDLHAGPGDIRPKIAAAAMFAAFDALQDSNSAAPPQPFSLDQASAVIDDVIRFLRGGLEALAHY
jgi:AcrR family transcriptional regulator